MDSNKKNIDGVSTGLLAEPKLIGKTSLITAIDLEDDIVARNTYLTIAIMTGGDMTADAIFDLYFPDGFVKYRNNNNCYVTLGS